MGIWACFEWDVFYGGCLGGFSVNSGCFRIQRFVGLIFDFVSSLLLGM